MITNSLLNTFKLTIEKNEHQKPPYYTNNKPNAKSKERKIKKSLKRIYSTKSLHFGKNIPWNFSQSSQIQSSVTERKPLFNTGIISQHNTQKGIIILKDFRCNKRKFLPQYELDRIFLEKISLPMKNANNIKKKQRPITSYNSPNYKRIDERVAKYKEFLVRERGKKIKYQHSNCNLQYLKMINPHIIKIKSAHLLYYQLRKQRPFNGNKTNLNYSFFK